MGWLKSLFGKESREPQKAFVPVTSLSEWFDEQTEALLDEIKAGIKQNLEAIHSEKAGVQEKINILKNAKLRNDNIPPRALQIMEGNRTSYINAVCIFLNQVNIPTAVNLGNITGFLATFEDSLSSFTKTSARNYMVLQEFFANESSAVAKRLNAMEQCARELLNNDYKDINLLREDISRLNGHLAMKQDSENRLQSEQASLGALLAETKLMDERLVDIKKSRDYRELETIEKGKNGVQQNMRRIEALASGFFSPLEKALRKFAKISPDDEKLLCAYAESPFTALKEDSGFRIVHALAQLKDAAANNQLDLNDKKKDKACAAIDAITGEKLQNLLAGCKGEEEEMQKLKKREQINTAAQKIDELKYKCEHLEQQKKVIEGKIQKIQKQAEAISSREVISEIQSRAEDVLGIKLRITGWKNENDKESG